MAIIHLIPVQMHEVAPNWRIGARSHHQRATDGAHVPPTTLAPVCSFPAQAGPRPPSTALDLALRKAKLRSRKSRAAPGLSPISGAPAPIRGRQSRQGKERRPQLSTAQSTGSESVHWLASGRCSVPSSAGPHKQSAPYFG
ncbi:hypothetical protein J7T55_012061 [Diaporthe amygdali]|uniref:uncharacterized protein n=1 Tax=Phomopsis amygdali TaxID=1214568 RepID=UPI0022FE4529|nr:uncharacterized protein J7T55_012061 [Diaporthe amygdali]KAJ0123596.1 hypothetical protein J7T55_012061 [Diaporthe amygdali]